MAAYIQGRNVNLTFRPPNRGPVRALHTFDIDVERRRVPVDRGTVRLRQEHLSQRPARAAQARFGRADAVTASAISGPGTDRAMVFQEFGLLPWRTVQHNVELGLELKRHAGRGAARDLRGGSSRWSGSPASRGHYPHELSGGMKQRVGLARALATDPDVLLMDEPFAALDAQTRDLMQVELLRIWHEARKTVLFVTHQIDEAIYLSDRVMVMTKRPGHAKRIFDIDLPRPRDYEMRVTPRIQRPQARNLARR